MLLLEYFEVFVNNNILMLSLDGIPSRYYFSERTILFVFGICGSFFSFLWFLGVSVDVIGIMVITGIMPQPIVLIVISFFHHRFSLHQLHMTLLKTIGDYKKCKRKEGFLFYFHKHSKALVECNCVGIVSLKKWWFARTSDVDAQFVLLTRDRYCFQSDFWFLPLFFMLTGCRQ